MTKINIILLGESGVGKTTLLLRFKTGEFPTSPDAATIGVDFHVRKVTLEGHEITFFIWDTAGDERHRSVVRSYYRQGEGVLLVYDVTNIESFYKLAGWLQELRNINEKAEVIIAGNKNEDASRKAVAVSAVKSFAKQENLEYIEMSAKSGINVEEVFLRLAKKVLIAKGILTDTASRDGTSDHRDSSSRNGNTPKNIQAKDPDIIRLESTPAEKPSEKESSSCC